MAELNRHLLAAQIIEAAEDAMQDDQPTTRHLGAVRLDTLLTVHVMLDLNLTDRRPAMVIHQLRNRV